MTSSAPRPAPRPAIGVNYTPRRGWFHSWLDLDAAEISEDLAQIADLGLDHVRIFPLWPLLQPHRTLISPRALEDLLTVVDLAAACGLDVSVDLLQGHLSSFDFLPTWVSTWHHRSIFTDPDVRAAQAELARTIGAELADRSRVTGMTLGNEIGQFARFDHPDRDDISPGQARQWTHDLLAEISTVLPQGRHHHCFDDALWFVDAHPFTPAMAVELGASTTVHSWVFTGAGQALGAGDPGLALFGRYLIEVADCWQRVCAADPERRIWLQEIGAPTPWISAEQAPAFADTSVRTALDHPRTEAVTWWCSHDVDRRLGDFPEVEYTLGLFDARGRTKPIGQVIGAIARELRETPAVSAPHLTPQPSLTVPALAPDGSNRSVLAPGGPAFAAWTEQALAGRICRLEPA